MDRSRDDVPGISDHSPFPLPSRSLGIDPALAAWGTVVVSQTVGAVGAAMSDGSIAHRAFENLDVFVSYGLQLPGLVALS